MKTKKKKQPKEVLITVMKDLDNDREGTWIGAWGVMLMLTGLFLWGTYFQWSNILAWIILGLCSELVGVIIISETKRRAYNEENKILKFTAPFALLIKLPFVCLTSLIWLCVYWVCRGVVLLNIEKILKNGTYILIGIGTIVLIICGVYILAKLNQWIYDRA